jgi:ribosomal protein S18 acetylase RimI-like enzyme
MIDSAARFVVRRATPADAEKMLALWQEAAEALAKADSRYHLAPDAAARWRISLQDWLNRDDAALFVAESTTQAGHVLGYIIGSIVANLPALVPERYGYVSDLAVDAHGKVGGIGRGLFEALKVWFHERGISHVEARVPHRHPVAQAFWRAIGATELYEQMWIKIGS